MLQNANRGPPRQLVSPLPSPALSSADSAFSISKYSHGPPANVNSRPAAGPPYQQHQHQQHQQPLRSPVDPSARTPSSLSATVVAPAPTGAAAARPGVFDTRTGSNSDTSSPVANERPADGALSPDPQAAMASEGVAHVHWRTFKRFLTGDVEQDHGRQNKAREKLTRLSRTQFQELSTDVFDEVQRRTKGSQAGQKALSPNASFHPKRNQAREKLASLPTSRFKYLTSDVFSEIERRYPNIAAYDDAEGDKDGRNSDASLSRSSSPPVARNGGETVPTQAPAEADSDRGREGRPSRRQTNPFRQTAVIPNKSTMVEEDLDSDYDESDLKSPRFDADYASIHSSEYGAKAISKKSGSPTSEARVVSSTAADRRVSELLAKINVLEVELKEKSDDKVSSSRQTKRDMEELLEQNDRLEEEVEALKAAAKAQKSEAAASDSKAEVERLREELREQQQVTEEVRAEAEGFLNEMRSLSDRETAVYERCESLQGQVMDLEAEVKVWKERYQKARTQLRQIKATSQFFSPSPNLKDGDGANFMDVNGAIRDVAVTRFQIAIDDLLRTARSDIPGLMDSMKDVILATQSIQRDLNTSRSPIVHEEMTSKLTQRMSSTLSNLMTACKNHMNGGPLSPVSLLDAAASHLSSTVIELAKICKLRPATHDEYGDEEDDGALPQNPAVTTRGDIKRPPVPISTVADIDRQYLSPPLSTDRSAGERRQGSINGKGLTISIPHEAAEEDSDAHLRDLLESEGIVASISKLLAAIRADDKPQVLQSHMREIVTIVTQVTSNMREAFLTSIPLRSAASGIVGELESCTSRIRDMEASVSRGSMPQATKEFKQRLAGVAFDTAKQTKELSLVLHQDGGDDADAVDSDVDLR